MNYYKHYKGHYYRVVGEARHSETLETMVVYQALYGDQSLWVRPKEMFYETVTLADGQVVPRFAPCNEEEALRSQQQTDAQYQLLLDKLFTMFEQKGYSAEDFQGGCALCGEANEFALDLIYDEVKQAQPDFDKVIYDRMTSRLYADIHHRFETIEAK